VWTSFSIVNPFLVRRLSRSSLAVATAHGCTLELYPNASHPRAHRITMPAGSIMETLSATTSRLHFPDGATILLTWHRGFYRWHHDA